MKKFLSVSFLLVLVISMLAACGNVEEGSPESAGDNGSSDGEAKKTLVMGTSADYPPYEYIDTAQGEDIIGFDIDIAKYITNELGYELKIENMDFNGLIPALNTEKVDFVMAGMTPKPERKKNADFSEIYYTAQQLIMTTKGSGIEKIEDLDGKKVGVQLGSIQEGEAEKIKEKVDIEVVKLNKIPEIIQELKSGRIDALIIEDAVAYEFIEKNEDLTSFVLSADAEAGSAVAFPKGSDLVEDFNSELAKMKENGKLDELVEKWFKINN
ncbi:transporter substrate-binding domain-containing protein [Pseudalkalibacillus caeni]|uniref:Transporter substrate-binding domain-containing protein n=1 Tax=Exobacillus caeni TaxID=2574798 RepID=A0A5R9EYY7_9BACL|nr:transporter substrate-binding domain-containing protein [Pseudalkalibacillus caeni]TLS36397.1 transporter substrate-binding domain-containing protein [Pseudalkalibacillus caeni]